MLLDSNTLEHMFPFPTPSFSPASKKLILEQFEWVPIDETEAKLSPSWPQQVVEKIEQCSCLSFKCSKQIHFFSNYLL